MGFGACAAATHTGRKEQQHRIHAMVADMHVAGFEFGITLNKNLLKIISPLDDRPLY
jgi:hypothetical protein